MGLGRLVLVLPVDNVVAAARVAMAHEVLRTQTSTIPNVVVGVAQAIAVEAVVVAQSDGVVRDTAAVLLGVGAAVRRRC